MPTLIICSSQNCMYSKNREDGLRQCVATTIGIDSSGKCDTILVLPQKIANQLLVAEEITNGDL